MLRTIVKINEDLCTGCGLCADACHEGAIGMVDGKARLLREDFCDGLGDCLPACPAGAISFEQRDAEAYDNDAVRAAKGRVRQWPIQLKLTPIRAPHFSDLLIAADCTAFTYDAFHRDFSQGRAVLIGCPKLDGVDYAEKLTAIFQENPVRHVTVVRMEVPCCGGLEFAVRRAIERSGKAIALEVVTISIDGHILK